MPNFQVAVNIAAKAQRSVNTAFRAVELRAREAGRRIARAGGVAGRGLTHVGAGMDKLAANRSFQVATVGITAGVVKSVQTAVRLEDAMLDLRKTAGALSKEDFSGFTKQLEAFAVSGRTRSSVDALYASASSLAQVGVAAGGGDFLLEWTKLADRAAVAFDITADTAASGLSKTVAALGADKSLAEQFDMATRLADAYNHLSNNMGSTAAQLLEFNQRTAGAAKGLGLSGAQSAAFGSALISMGTRVESASTAFNSMAVRLLDIDNQSTKTQEAMEELGFTGAQLKTMFARDAQGALLQVLTALSKLDKQGRTSIANRVFGVEHGDEITKLTGSIEKYIEALGLVRNETLYLGSATQEADTRLSGMGAKLTRVQNQLTLTSSALGEALFPVIESGLSVITPGLEGLAYAVDNIPGLSTALGIGTAAGGLGVLAVGAKKLFGELGGGAAAKAIGARVLPLLATPGGATVALTAAILGLTAAIARTGYNALGGGTITDEEREEFTEEERRNPTGFMRGSPASDARFVARAVETATAAVADPFHKFERELHGFPSAVGNVADAVAKQRERFDRETADLAAVRWAGDEKFPGLQAFPGETDTVFERAIYQFQDAVGTAFDPRRGTHNTVFDDVLADLNGRADDYNAFLGGFDDAIEKMRSYGRPETPTAPASQVAQAASLSEAFGVTPPPRPRRAEQTATTEPLRRAIEALEPTPVPGSEAAAIAPAQAPDRRSYEWHRAELDALGMGRGMPTGETAGLRSPEELYSSGPVEIDDRAIVQALDRILAELHGVQTAVRTPTHVKPFYDRPDYVAP